MQKREDADEEVPQRAASADPQGLWSVSYAWRGPSLDKARFHESACA